MDAPFVIATGFWRIFLERLGLAAITMPWRKVYILARYVDHDGLRSHELVHIEQIERDGPVMFSVKYLFWLARYGYWDNPYETEAYARAPIE
jgi:hypothetical protein